MSHRQKSKGSFRMRTRYIPSLWFTVDEVVLLRQALIPFEQLIVTSKQPLPHLRFAHETVQDLQKKLLRMLRFSEETIPLDKNEVIILHSSLWLYMLALQETQLYEKSLCLALSRKITPIANSVLKR